MKTTINYTKLVKLGTYRDQWRERVVTLYAHPTDATRVVSVGIGIHNGKETVCDEARTDFPKQLVHDDWSTCF